jgi:steroid delta-isomerase-like uncharacterized protein
MSEANKEIARRYYSEIMNTGSQSTIDELIASDFIFDYPLYPAPEPGPETFKQLVNQFRDIFSNAYFNIETLIAEGGTVVVQWTCHGNQLGSIQTPQGAIPPSGKPFTLTGKTWLEIVDGKIKAAHIDENALGMYMQLGLIPSPAAASPVPPSSPGANKAIVRRYFNEIMSQGNLEVIDQLMADDFVIKVAGLHDPFRGPEGMKQFVTGLRSAFADMQFTIEELVAEGDRVACRFTSFSSHQGEFAGVPPSGNPVKDRGTDLFRIVNGKIVEVLVTDNALGVMQQIGAIPTALF